MAQLGAPYQWGAEGPDTFDCSGLTSFAYHAAGLDIPRVSRVRAPPCHAATREGRPTPKEARLLERLLVERHGWVTVLTINRPEAHNCIDAETAVAIAAAIEGFADDPGARVLVVTGAGPSSFSSGADLKHTGALWGHEAFEEAGPLGFARLDPGKPAIAAVNGYCFAGGMELAAWCDFRIASETAEFGVLNRRWGVPLIDGGTQRLARIVGLGNALYLIETGVRLDARGARALGFVQEVVPEGQALPRALEVAARIAEYPQASLRSDRRAAVAAFDRPLEAGLLFERELGAATLEDPEMAAALRRFAGGERPEPPRPPGTSGKGR